MKLSRFQRRTLLALEVIVAGYWLWVLWATLTPQPSSFDAIVRLSAPLLLSMHFVEGLVFVRRLRGQGPWLRDFVLILFFGVLHLLQVLARGVAPAPGPPRRSSSAQA